MAAWTSYISPTLHAILGHVPFICFSNSTIFSFILRAPLPLFSIRFKLPLWLGSSSSSTQKAILEDGCFLKRGVHVRYFLLVLYPQYQLTSCPPPSMSIYHFPCKLGSSHYSELWPSITGMFSSSSMSNIMKFIENIKISAYMSTFSTFPRRCKTFLSARCSAIELIWLQLILISVKCKQNMTLGLH